MCLLSIPFFHSMKSGYLKSLPRNIVVPDYQSRILSQTRQSQFASETTFLYSKTECILLIICIAFHYAVLYLSVSLSPSSPLPLTQNVHKSPYLAMRLYKYSFISTALGWFVVFIVACGNVRMGAHGSLKYKKEMKRTEHSEIPSSKRYLRNGCCFRSLSFIISYIYYDIYFLWNECFDMYCTIVSPFRIVIAYSYTFTYLLHWRFKNVQRTINSGLFIL